MRLLLTSLLFLACSFATAETRILVQSSPLAGAQYYELPALLVDIKPGDALSLHREPDNAHDRNAVRVEWQGRKLGYLPRAENRAVAKALADGENVEARVNRLQAHRNPWQRLLIDVWLRL